MALCTAAAAFGYTPFACMRNHLAAVRVAAALCVLCAVCCVLGWAGGLRRQVCCTTIAFNRVR